MQIAIEPKELLKRTTSRCPTCHRPCPAEVTRENNQVFLTRTCPDHGPIKNCLATDARFYWLSRGKESNACCNGGSCRSPNELTDPLHVVPPLGGSPSNAFRKPDGEHVVPSRNRADGSPLPAYRALDLKPNGTLGRNAAGRGSNPFETLATCLALIEIVHSCNLSCPTCYADSPTGPINAVPLEEIKTRVQGVIDRKGRLEILQLSGGEPTLHPQFFELLDWIQSHPKIDYVLVNTNGLLLARDEKFVEQFAPRAARKRIQLYLQFDGVQTEAQHFLRGADLRKLREQAIANCQRIQLPITLAMTVTPENLPHLWQAIDFGLKFPNIRGICFQPMFNSGRTPTANTNTTRLNTADIILAAVEQSAEKLRFEDFTPLPCGDPNCATIGYLLKIAGQTRSVSDFIDFTRVQDFLRDKVRYRLEDLIQCGCESQPLAEILKKFELDESNTFRILVKPFMDAWTWDEDRIDRCCTHVIRPDGKLDSFCRYYSGFA